MRLVSRRFLKSFKSKGGFTTLLITWLKDSLSLRTDLSLLYASRSIVMVFVALLTVSCYISVCTHTIKQSKLPSYKLFFKRATNFISSICVTPEGFPARRPRRLPPPGPLYRGNYLLGTNLSSGLRPVNVRRIFAHICR